MNGDEVIVHVSPKVAAYLSAPDTPTPETEEIRTEAHRLGVRLEQMHPDVDDVALIGFFRAQVSDREAGERVARDLLTCTGVLSAYWKPAAEPP